MVMARRRERRRLACSSAVTLCALLWALIAWSLYPLPTAGATPALCKRLDAPKDLLTGHASDIAIVEQGYRCILSHYIAGKIVDDRTLLRGAFNEIAGSLPSSLSAFTLPSLLGDRDIDWQLFADEYDAISSLLQPTASVQQALAELALFGMTMSLHDDHLAYWPQDETKIYISQLSPGTPAPTLGIVTAPVTKAVTSTYVTDVLPGTPAARAGLRPGDTIEQVNGKAVVAGGQETAALGAVSIPRMGTAVSLSLFRPSTGAYFTVSLQPKLMVTPFATARVVGNGIAYVRLFEFSADAASRVFTAIKGLHLGTAVRGVVLDLRGNPGGAEDQAVQILSAFARHAVVGYEVQGSGKRVALRTDSTVSALHGPLVVLTDGDSASSSELVASAVRDLKLGKVVGSRTGGELAGAYFYSLSDASALEITAFHVLGAKGEKVDKVGVAPDQQVTVTAAELSAGDDPVVDQAVRDIQQG